MVDVKIGQLYSFHLNSKDPVVTFQNTEKDALIQSFDIVMEVTIIKGFVGITPVKDKTGWFEIGQQYIASKRDFEKPGNYRLIWDPAANTVFTKNGIEYGADCPKCKNHYPHAEKTTDFMCWACRNKF